MNNLLENLNNEQLQAVLHKDGPLLIIAGAGTGKTTIIAQRIAYLIEQGRARSDEVLALTFTEKAAQEMEDRVNGLLPIGYLDLWISTFHGFGERILKEHGLDAGLPSDFKLLNEFEQWALVRKNLDKFNLDYYRPLGNPAKFIHALIKHFSRAKDENVSPAEYLAYADGLRENMDGMMSGAKTTRQPDNKTARQARRQTTDHRRQNTNNGDDGDVNAQIANQEVTRINEVASAYHSYQQLLLDNNALDFGDLINYCIMLFKKRPAILEKYRGQFKYILLDEFQDTNWAQYELVKMLACPANNLAVVGDDDQSIYKFRGASVSNILQFEKDFPDAKKIVLTRNYRNTQDILDLSYKFIQINNPNRLEWQIIRQQDSETARQQDRRQTKENRKRMTGGRRQAADAVNQKLSKRLTASNKNAGVIEVLEGRDLNEEVRLVVEKIADLKIGSKRAAALLSAKVHPEASDSEATWSDFAILVRANDSAREFASALDIAGFPYVFLSSRGLYTKPVVMDSIAYFKLLDNYHESAAMYRILNLPVFDFKSGEIADFARWADKKTWSIYEALKNAAALHLDQETCAKAERLLSLVARHSGLAREKPASEILLAFFNDTGYLKYLTGRSERSSRENAGYLNQFYRRIKEFEAGSDDKSVNAFLAELAMEIGAGEQGNLAQDYDSGPEAIKIMTVHSAKGLEFRYVFIPNLVDKRFPTIERREAIALPDALVKEILPEGDVHLEEERRLFYVAMTRAKEHLYLSWSPDYGGARKKKPSLFFHETGLLLAPAAFQKTGGRQSTSFQKGGERGVDQKISIDNFHMLNASDNGRQATDSRIINEKIILPSRFSYTQLAAYNNCPYQYRFAHILKIPVRGKAQFSFGKTMHAVLQKIFRLVMEKGGLGQGNLFGSGDSRRPKAESWKTNGESQIQKSGSPRQTDDVSSSEQRSPDSRQKVDIDYSEVLNIYNSSWVDEWYESKPVKEEYRARGKAVLKAFHAKYNLNWPEVIFLEKGFNFKIKDDEASYTVRGVIDRIDNLNGKLKITDYKTGRPKEKLDFEDKEQLFIYQLAARDFFDQEVAALSFYYLEENKEIEFLGKPGELAKINKKIISTIRQMTSGLFPARPSLLCQYCDFSSICEYRQN